MGLAKAHFTGRIGVTPEVKETEGNFGTVRVLSIPVYVKRNYKNSEGTYESDSLYCVAWAERADFIAANFKKGDLIELACSIKTRYREDKKSGAKYQVCEFIVDEISFVMPRNTEAKSDV